jgi:hypothetical protein
MAVGHVLTCSAIFVVCCLYYDIGAWKWQNVTQSYFAVYHSDWGQQNGSFGGLFDADVSCVARRIFRLQGKNNVNGTADSYGMESMESFTNIVISIWKVSYTARIAKKVATGLLRV